MPQASISKDATIENVLPTLQKPEEYVRVILENLYKCEREHQTCSVRIGITGEGKAPYYRIDYLDQDGSLGLFGSFSGKVAGQGIETHEETWSNKSMTKSEVAEVLGRIRKS